MRTFCFWEVALVLAVALFPSSEEGVCERSANEIIDRLRQGETNEFTMGASCVLQKQLLSWSVEEVDDIVLVIEAIGDYSLGDAHDVLVEYIHRYPSERRSLLPASEAIRSIAKMGDAESREVLIRLAQQAPVELLDTVALSMGTLRDEAVVIPLEKLAVHENAKVRMRAISALAAYCRLSSWTIAVQALNDPDSKVRNSATWWLRKCGEFADDRFLERQLRDTNPLVRLNAAKGLTRLRSTSGCEEMRNLLDDESRSVREAAAEYLKESCGVVVYRE